jgi:mannose-1-phosphate guanylyltransferase
MKAVILAGGLATRLRPLTIERPKSLVPVLNRYFLEHVLFNLKNSGIEEIVLATGHMGQTIEERLGDGQKFGVRLFYAKEDRPLGTAGAIRNCAAHLDSSFLVLNGDIFTDINYAELIEFHQKVNATISILTTIVEDPSAFGLISTDRSGRVIDFSEKPKPGTILSGQINAGVYILNPEVLDCIPQGECSLEREIFPRLINNGKPVFAYKSDAYWIDIGTPENYLKLNQDMLTGKCRANLIEGLFKEDNPGGPILIGEGTLQGHNVKIFGPTVIGNNCRIEDGAIIEASLLWDSVLVEEGVTIKNSIIASNCRLNCGSQVLNSVIGPRVSISANTILGPGSRIFP